MKVPPGEPVSDSPVNLLPDRVKERLFPIPVSPRIVSAVCPKAGNAKKIDQNMQKYREIDPKKSNDFASIRARFKAPGKKYRSLDQQFSFFFCVPLRMFAVVACAIKKMVATEKPRRHHSKLA